MGKNAAYFLLGGILLLAFSTGTARAEYYRYKDAKGVTRYTDNLGEVPLDQRKAMTTYQSVAPKPKEETKDAAAASGKGKDGKASEAEKSLADQMAALNAEKAALEKEQKELSAQRTALESERAQATTPAARTAVNDKARAYNERVKAYDARRVAYEKKVNDFTAQRSGK